jgi:hypothetical protein
VVYTLNQILQGYIQEILKKNTLTEYDPYTLEKIREVPLGG